ncbi:hypothetical protein RchiOBHm_Chr1g0341481 [Rosa chinensis]|uniref:Uncharacterized protein n=1 Tax=Rosa chinensis TaxID=74649 RepID=A0A2P6SDR1_ROSCH|nr:hypothetical protein RchiOBHm_Chr1g0341481 [Rosa chinensis]
MLLHSNGLIQKPRLLLSYDQASSLSLHHGISSLFSAEQPQKNDHPSGLSARALMAANIFLSPFCVMLIPATYLCS